MLNLVAFTLEVADVKPRRRIFSVGVCESRVPLAGLYMFGCCRMLPAFRLDRPRRIKSIVAHEPPVVDKPHSPSLTWSSRKRVLMSRHAAIGDGMRSASAL